MDLSLNYLKEIIMGLLFFVTILCVFIPMKLAHNAQRSGVDIFHSERYSKIVSILNCFAAGIFLGTCLLHLFPDVRQTVTAAVALIDPKQNFPFAEFTIVMGFMLLLTIEQIMSDIRERRLGKLTQRSPRLNSTTVIVQSQPPQLPRISETDEEDNSIDNRSIDNLDNSVLIEAGHSRRESRNQQQQIQQHNHNPDVTIVQNDDQHSVRVVAMIIAISIHSVFEGCAIGVQGTEEEVLQITSALAIHKLVISFSVGLSLTQCSMKLFKSIIFGLIFASATPIGTAIGLGVTLYEKDLDNSLIVGVLQGIAAGTFLYVTFLDVLPHEFKNGQAFHLPKLLSFIIGFSIICLSLFLFPDS